MKRLVVGFVAALMSFAMMPAAFAHSAHSAHNGGSHERSRHRDGGSGDPNDVKFLNEVSEANLYEIAAGKLAESSTDTATAALGTMMVTDHTTAQAALTTLASGLGVTLTTTPDHQQRHDLRDLTNADPGLDFNLTFARQMVETHKDAIGLFTDEVNDGNNAQVMAFATAALPTLQAHLTAAKSLLASLKMQLEALEATTPHHHHH